ncbi:MAG: hypothetical protein ABI325_13510 [Ginsengibacter sp.]
MQKLFPFILIGFSFFLNSCHSNKTRVEHSENDSSEVASIFPVTEFLKGQLKMIDGMQTTPLKILISNGKTDSMWLKREDVRTDATPFLQPEIDSITMSPFFSETSFLDQTINAFTFSYYPKVRLPDSLHLTHWDVYINPQSREVQRIYLVKETDENNNHITTQLTWVTDGWYSIRTITQSPDKNEPDVKEEKMIWSFD